MKRQVNSYWEGQKVAGHKALLEARKIATGEDAILKILERMEFIGSDDGRVDFCHIFALREKYCVFDDCIVCSLSDEELQTACQRCIDKFLREYYKA